MKTKFDHLNVTVLGCGAWATTIANHIACNGFQTTIWCYKQDIADEINTTSRRNKLNNVILSPSLKATADLKHCITHTDAIILCVPSCYLATLLKSIKPFLNSKTPILSLIKGIVSEDYIFIHDYCKSMIGDFNYSILSGPNLALEIAHQKPAAAVVASDNSDSLQLFQHILSNKIFRIYTSNDVIGVSCGGILKNIFAIASGCIDALDLGHNTKATLITRALNEMIQFSTFYGADSKTLHGLSGLGDLIATCHSSLSRNYQYGFHMAQGKTIQAIQKDLNAIAEGVQSTKFIYHLSQKESIEMPITKQVYNVLYKNMDVSKAINQLMLRELRTE